jgi:hypothetical protein
MTLLYTEHYRCSLMRTLRDVDLHRPATRRRRRVELPNPIVHIPSVTHQYRAPTTHRTNTCLQSYQRNHHYRDFLYNIRHNTEHKYINFDRLRARHGVNITRTPWVTVTSLPIPVTTYPKKRTPPRIRHCRLPHFPNTPEQTGEKTLIIRIRANVRLSILTNPSFHRATKPNTTHLSHTGLIGAYHYDTCMHLCPYAPCRRSRGVGRG